MPTTSLSREQWTAAALGALLREGPEAVAVQPLARSLSATKGSFYWHFTNRDALLSAALDAWLEQHTERVVRELDALDLPPDRKLRMLFATVTDSAARNRGELRLLAGVSDPAVAAAVQRATDRRVAYVRTLLEASGVPAAEASRRAVLAYATYLGFAQLNAAAPRTLPRGRAARAELLDAMIRVVLA